MASSTSAALVHTCGQHEQSPSVCHEHRTHATARILIFSPDAAHPSTAKLRVALGIRTLRPSSSFAAITWQPSRDLYACMSVMRLACAGMKVANARPKIQSATLTSLSGRMRGRACRSHRRPALAAGHKAPGPAVAT